MTGRLSWTKQKMHSGALLTFKMEFSGRALVSAADGDAEKPGSQPHTGSTCAVLKIRTIYVRAPKGKNRENDGPAACNPKFDNFGS